MSEEKSSEEVNAAEKTPEENSAAEGPAKLKEFAKIWKTFIFIMMFFSIALGILQINLVAGATALFVGGFLLIFWFFYVVVKDERIQRICEKAFTSAFMVFAVFIGIACLAMVLMVPLQLSIITQISPLIFQLAYALFIIIALFVIFYLFYQRRM
ncbi:MAG TPA: DUF2178 domain-containing protein [Candidatus Lokiarchaeia archaeon]|nr:DUF2178 domain-containing protein [Candidatus Lokiarchaeia archaeon]